MDKQDSVRFTGCARQCLHDVVRKLKGTSAQVRRAQRLRKADADGPHEPDAPMPATPQPAQRIDYAYERAGPASIFLCAAPLSGWRSVRVLPQRTHVDWARDVAGFLTTRYATAAQRLLVCDHVNTPPRGACSEAFEPTSARESGRRLACCDTPTPGRWLHIADNARRAMTRPCVAPRRFGDIATLHRATSAWAKDVHQTQQAVAWHFPVANARTQ